LAAPATVVAATWAVAAAKTTSTAAKRSTSPRLACSSSAPCHIRFSHRNALPLLPLAGQYTAYYTQVPVAAKAKGGGSLPLSEAQWEKKKMKKNIWKPDESRALTPTDFYNTLLSVHTYLG
jgi:hypothetical protein